MTLTMIVEIRVLKYIFAFQVNDENIHIQNISNVKHRDLWLIMVEPTSHFLDPTRSLVTWQQLPVLLQPPRPYRMVPIEPVTQWGWDLLHCSRRAEGNYLCHDSCCCCCYCCCSTKWGMLRGCRVWDAATMPHNKNMRMVPRKSSAALPNTRYARSRIYETPLNP